MQNKISITLDDDEIQALKVLAGNEMRHYRSQAAYMIKQELKEKVPTIKQDSKVFENLLQLHAN
jgi:uncharacterized protein with FMN-binding domain